MKKYKYLIRCAAVAVICAAAIFAGVYALCIWKTYAAVHGGALESRTVLYAKILSGAVSVCALFWIMSIQIRIHEKKEASRFREDTRKIAQNFDYRSSAATLFDIIDDNRGNKAFFSLYGDRVKPGDEPGTLFMIMRMIAIIFTFITVSAGLVIVCAFLSLSK